MVTPTEAQTINQLLVFIRREAKKLFFTKHLSWKGENEYRIVSRDNAFLDISGAISAIHLTSYSSDECLFVEKLVNGEVPVKYLHYLSAAGQAMPVMTDTQSTRKKWDDAQKNKNNAYQMLSQQARSFYEEHKNDGDFPLILQ